MILEGHAVLGTTPKENTGCFGPIYWTSLDASPLQPLVSTAWTREVEEPWRRGRGLAVRTGGKRLVTVGIWFRGPRPVAEDEPRGLNVGADTVRGYKNLTIDSWKRRREMLKLILWPLALAAALWRAYKFIKNAPINWDLPFEQS